MTTDSVPAHDEELRVKVATIIHWDMCGCNDWEPDDPEDSTYDEAAEALMPLLSSLLASARADGALRAALEQLPEGGLSLWTDTRALNAKRVRDTLDILDAKRVRDALDILDARAAVPLTERNGE